MSTVHGSKAAGGRRRSPYGFTTLELLVVVAILAILAAFGLPAMLGLLERSRVEAAASELAGALRRAQALAVAQGGFFRVHLGSDVGRQNSYRIEQNNGAGWPADTDTMQTVPNPGVITDWVDLGAQYRGVTLGFPVDSANRTLRWITYNGRGAFMDPTGLPVTPPARIPVRNQSGATRTVVAEFARGARVQ